VLACDAEVRSDEPFRGTMPHLVGGGGTSLDAGLVAADAHSPDAIVYFTDGFVDAVRHGARAPIFWLLTREGLEPESPEARALLRGRRVKMR
jgi:predicted metal-dependent peptidase